MSKRCNSWIVCIATALVITVGVCLFGQNTASPDFEIASIKPNLRQLPVSDTGVVYESPGRLIAEAALLSFLIQDAYGVRSYQVVGGPEWINSARYDIEAETESNARPE